MEIQELSKKSNRGSRMTKNQKDILINYLENNKDMLSSKVSPVNFGKITTHWDTLTNLLNIETKGAKKTAKQWKEAWNELKTNAKRRAREVRYDITGTAGGGGKKKAKILSEIEEIILELLSSVVIEGVPLAEAGVGTELDNSIVLTKELATDEDLVGVYITLPVEDEVQRVRVPASLLETPTTLQLNIPAAAVQVDEVAPPSAANKKTAKKRKYPNPIQQVATMHEKCLHNVAASNNNIAQALIRLAGSITNKAAKGTSSVFQLKF